MANSFEKATWITMTALALFKNKLAIAATFDKSFNREFNRSFPIGDTTSVPLPQRFLPRHGLTYSPQAINARHTTISFNEPDGVDFEWDDAEKALNMPRGEDQVRERYIMPAMATLFQLVDSNAAQFAYQNTPNVVGALGTNPTTFDGTSAPARQIMKELATPDNRDRGLFIPPVVMRSLKNTAIGYFNPAVDISKQYREGIVGRADGFDFYESMSLYRHTAGTWAGAVTVSGASQSGSSLLVNCTSGDTFKKGDKFSINNVLPVNPMTRRTFSTTARVFTITADTTATASTATISIYPSIDGPGSQYQDVDSLPANTAALTLWPGTTSPNGKSGVVGLAIDPTAFAMVTKPLGEPKGSVEFAKEERDPQTGVTLRFVRFWDGQRSVMCNRFDVMVGFGVLLADSSSVAIACA